MRPKARALATAKSLLAFHNGLTRQFALRRCGNNGHAMSDKVQLCDRRLLRPSRPQLSPSPPSSLRTERRASLPSATRLVPSRAMPSACLPPRSTTWAGSHSTPRIPIGSVPRRSPRWMMLQRARTSPAPTHGEGGHGRARRGLGVQCQHVVYAPRVTNREGSRML